MNKPIVLISSPFDTYSGYGARARDIIKELIKTDKYNVKLLSQRWGDTSWGFCNKNEEYKHLLEHRITDINKVQNPDIFIQITIPSEFKRLGRINIGITAGIETDLCPPEWIEGLNVMDFNLVSSEHSKNVFDIIKYTKNVNNNKQTIENKKPLDVLFEGLDPNKFYKKDSSDFKLDIKEDFCFLVVGQWLQGELGEDRKNIGLTVKTFIDSFRNISNPPALVLKVSTGNNSKINKYYVSKKIESIKKLYNNTDVLPNIYLINGDLTDEEMNELYNHDKIKAMVSLTKGEGFGRPLLEFSFVGKPIMCPYWSGQKDFLSIDNFISLRGELKKISPSSVNKWLISEGNWFNVYEDEVRKAYKVMHSNYKKYKNKAEDLRLKNTNKFSLSKMNDSLDNLLSELLKQTPVFVEFNKI